jgi:hypothetical protein
MQWILDNWIWILFWGRNGRHAPRRSWWPRQKLPQGVVPNGAEISASAKRTPDDEPEPKHRAQCRQGKHQGKIS